MFPCWNKVVADNITCIDQLNESSSSIEEQIFILADSISKGMDFTNDPQVVECSFHLSLLQICQANLTDCKRIFNKQSECYILFCWKWIYPGLIQYVMDNKEISYQKITKTSGGKLSSTNPWFSHSYNGSTSCLATLVHKKFMQYYITTTIIPIN